MRSRWSPTSACATRQRRLRERVAAVVEASPDAITSCTLDGTVLSWNQGAERLYGYLASEVVGRQLPALAPPGELAGVLASIGRGERLQQVDTVRYHKDGSLLEVSITVSPMRAADGSIVGAAAIARDVSERRRAERAEASLREAEEQLRQAQKLEAVGQLAGGVAHDFNNLLRSSSATASMLMERPPEPAIPCATTSSEIHKAGERAPPTLTRQLLAFSRQQVLAARGPRPQRRSSAASERMLRRIDRRGHRARDCRSTRELAASKADPGQIEQVLMNLAVNARDAMPTRRQADDRDGQRRPRSRLRGDHVGATPGDYVMLAVTDTGIGMDAATQARIFEPFFTTKEIGKGTGPRALDRLRDRQAERRAHLGLQRARPGHDVQGLPAAASTATLEHSPQRRRVGRPRARHETILLVEDEDQVRVRRRAASCARAGYRVLEAAQRAARRCSSRATQRRASICLLTDVVMPRMSGHRARGAPRTDCGRR